MTPEQEQQLFDSVNAIRNDVTGLKTDVEHLTTDVEHLKTDVEKLTKTVEDSNLKFGYYQQANQQLVNLAFGLIASATVIVIVSSVLGK